ncbi:dihydrodipicolinate synthase family protein [Paenibacillus sp. GCM10023248]|uniref:dihydrodipicolinate synthase family protein n=1 Tax=unclassified Paenibacillus TaxID=185978 RepID=UPI0023789FC9|nr:dihydrodipicolinate synthase family protein [Paenibacillus sp. MAHUQ-63]MDD9269427.1 dihydrodipicolinate synthase family protein [Paenibacillus sp. MAHUQ-63]
MKINNPDGVWPTMITLYKESGDIDFDAMERMIDWFIQNKVDGLFAVCQSSEMFFLSLEERVKLAAFVVEKAAGRVPVIASGHISDSLEDQVRELTAISETGVEAVILISNRMAAQEESDDVWKSNAQRLLDQLPEHVALGIYECPFPYKRLLSPSELKWCADTGRFFFLKDTSCDVELIKEKLAVIQGTPLKLYNANTATLLESLKLGVNGYSGVMANFHPDLYVWFLHNWETKPEEAEYLLSILAVASFIERQLYPVNAKYAQMMDGIAKSYYSRARNHEEFTATNRLEVEHLYRLSKQLSQQFPAASAPYAGD